MDHTLCTSSLPDSLESAFRSGKQCMLCECAVALLHVRQGPKQAHTGRNHSREKVERHVEMAQPGKTTNECEGSRKLVVAEKQASQPRR